MADFSFVDNFQNFANIIYPILGRTLTRTVDVSSAGVDHVTGSGTFTLQAYGDFGPFDENETATPWPKFVTVAIDGTPLGHFLNHDETDDRFWGPSGDEGNQYRYTLTGIVTLTEQEIDGIIADGKLEISYTFSQYIDDFAELYGGEEFVKATLSFTAVADENRVVKGLDGDDVLWGGDGNDILSGGAGNDVINGGAGNDTIAGGPGDDTLEGWSGRDTISYADAAHAVSLTLRYGYSYGQSFDADSDGFDRLSHIEDVVGSRYNDSLSGDFYWNRLAGGPGDDTLDGDKGRDTAVYYDAPRGVVADLAAGVADGNGHDQLIQIESLVGSRFDDILSGDAGNNWLTGREGDDLLDGRGGSDVASFAYAHNGVSVQLEGTPGSGQGHATGEGHDTLTGIEGVVGSTDHDFLSGSVGADWLSGGRGDDRLEGGAGADLFVFGPGSGADHISGFEPGIDRIQLAGLAPASFDGLRANFADEAGGTTLHLDDGSTITFTGLTAAQLAAADFIWA